MIGLAKPEKKESGTQESICTTKCPTLYSERKIREINSLVISLVKPLVSRIFCKNV